MSKSIHAEHCQEFLVNEKITAKIRKALLLPYLNGAHLRASKHSMVDEESNIIKKLAINFTIKSVPDNLQSLHPSQDNNLADNNRHPDGNNNGRYDLKHGNNSPTQDSILKRYQQYQELQFIDPVPCTILYNFTIVQLLSVYECI